MIPRELKLALLLGTSISPSRVFAAPPPSKDAIARVQALDSAAIMEEGRLQNHCKDPKAADKEGARIAERAAQIHVARIDIARLELQVDARALTPLALQAVSAFRQAYRCDPSSRRPLEDALSLLRELRKQVPPDGGDVLSGMDARIHDLEAELSEHDRQHPAPGKSISSPSVRFVYYTGEVVPQGPSRKTYLGHLALRVEVGGGVAPFSRYGVAGHYTHRGVYLRLTALARFFPGRSSRVGLLFGPYFNFMTLNPLDGAILDWPGSGSLTSFGAQAELHLVPAKRFPRFSINPSLMAGMGYVRVKDLNTPNFGGAYGGAGLYVCFLSGALCPGVRITSAPVYYDTRIPTFQGGLSFDVLRFADAVIAYKQRDIASR